MPKELVVGIVDAPGPKVKLPAIHYKPKRMRDVDLRVLGEEA